MKFDIFCEIQRPYPWNGRDEASLFQEILAHARAADVAGFDTWWQVEHHGAPEFSYASAPELVLTAIAMVTERLRVGHAGVLAPFAINTPLRVAERGATLDVLSGGRFELGLAKSGGKEWETFGVQPDKARDQVRDALKMIPRMWTEKEFSWTSADYNVPPREIVPKPLQQPHPRLWQTCGSPESFFMAGELGVGALGTTLLSPVAFLGQMLREHDRGLAACQEPAGKVVNAQKGCFTFVHLADSRAEAIANGAAWSALWYVNAAAVAFKVPRRVWYDMIKAGLHPNSARDTAALTERDPHETDILPDDPPVVVVLKRMAQGQTISHEEAHEVLEPLDCVVIGDPDHCIGKLRGYEAIGADRMMCMMQFGTIPHAAVLKSIALTGRHVAPVFDRQREGTPA
ncbi:MAG: LLM class flavin-dependent oxidoreductase [Alphaproteobacteria bacterium]|nr:LLM class flavin-dependent oxidoreductase [Alphaproteobacteria bacterium]MBU1515876.1 LLM class flavin-dependent oxidoreductase [Alphaproteobacteria bacterium]MBU2094098.1 LLM class flavin-dependent oxidoreductase [Alphaproteobacteria bacterium]MBU2151450.1 LLM class flavin-dependent oxidoreductase [Alphaproteobacteria bacterium]MBU2305274.1 LLM class flavin-dependent oxidoreductase [Alphaproteobacteria bacterium]